MFLFSVVNMKFTYDGFDNAYGIYFNQNLLINANTIESALYINKISFSSASIYGICFNGGLDIENNFADQNSITFNYIKKL